MIRFILILYLNLLCGLLSAQQICFSNNYDYYSSSNIGGAVKQTSDSGYVVISSTITAPNRGYTFTRLDKYGDTVFTKSYIYGGLYFQLGLFPNSILTTANGDYLVCGWVSGGVNNKEGVLVRFSSIGDTIWTKMYGDTADQDLTTILETPNGYIAGGSTTTGGNGTSDLWVLRLDSGLNDVWDTSYATTQNDAIICGTSTWDGGFLFGGRSASVPYILKTDPWGHVEWEMVYTGYAGYGYVSGASDSTYYVACGKLISGQDYDACLLHLDTAGNILWDELYGDINRSETFSCPPVVSGTRITMGGGSRLFTDYYEGYVVQADLSGNAIWLRRYAQSMNWHQYIYDLESTLDGGYVAAGSCLVNTQDVWVLKLDSLGCDSIGCDGVGIGNQPPETQISIYPNPASDEFTFDFGESDDCVITIHDIFGREMLIQNIRGRKFILNTSSWPAGTYTCTVITSQGIGLATEKLMIVR